MSEAIDDRHAPRAFSWTRALTAGVIATVVITVTMMLTGQNIMKMLGSMLLPAAGVATQYMVGGAMHLMIGLFYGVAYAWLVGRVSEWNRFVKGAVYGLAITGVALAVMPAMEALMGGGGASNPCGGSSAAADNPSKAAGASNPCNPSQASAAATNPCTVNTPANPCSAEAAGATPSNACHAASGTNPCGGGGNPCNPCGGSGGATSGLMSLIHHLVFGLTLAVAYGRGR